MNRPAAVPIRETDIAIVGMSGRFPGADQVDRLWTNLRDGRVSIEPTSDATLAAAGVPAEDICDPAYLKFAATMPNADRFDAAFFGYAPREASYIDPQQRVLLECAWAALEDAGLSRPGYPFPVGVFAGCSLNTYLLATGLGRRLAREFVLTLSSSDKDFLATRIAYKLNLSGPAVTVQTACSTSLVAIHLACQALLDRECDLALAGGVAVKVPLNAGYFWKKDGIVSRDGAVRSFDASASGTVFGSGAGLVVLKRLKDALADDDIIRAVIKGSAVNNDGNAKASFTAPSVDRQAEVIVEALARADLPPSAIGYVEAHGTGTALGDPIEFAALCKAFGGDGDRSSRCAIGSIKPNVGHLEAAAGIAGLIKVVLALERCEIPPLTNFESPNPACDFDSSPFYVPIRPTPWPDDERPRRAGISALGVGGTNAHVVLEQAPARSDPAGPRDAAEWCVLPVSARSEASLARSRWQLADALDAHRDLSLADVAYTLQLGRCEFSDRAVVVATSAAEAAAALRNHPTGGAVARSRRRPVVMVRPDSSDVSPAEWRELLGLTGAGPDAMSDQAGGGRPGGEQVTRRLHQLWSRHGLVVDEVRREGDVSDAGGLVVVVLGRASAAASLGTGHNVVVVGSLSDQGAGRSVLQMVLTGIGTVWAAGGSIDWRRHQDGRSARGVRLPTYPFEPTRHWYDDTHP